MSRPLSNLAGRRDMGRIRHRSIMDDRNLTRDLYEFTSSQRQICDVHNMGRASFRYGFGLVGWVSSGMTPCGAVPAAPRIIWDFGDQQPA